MTNVNLALRIWLLTSIAFGLGVTAFFCISQQHSLVPFGMLAVVGSGLASLPALVVLLIAFPFLKRKAALPAVKWQWLLGLQLLTCLPYGMLYSLINLFDQHSFVYWQAIENCTIATGILFACNLAAILCSLNQVNRWVFGGTVRPASRSPLPDTNPFDTKAILSPDLSFSHIKTSINMNSDAPATEHDQTIHYTTETSSNSYNKTLVKAAITAGLILGMLIPTAYITNLVEEREQRHKEVVQEVSAKWATAQTLTTPYISIPYLSTAVNDTGKLVTVKKMLYLPANTLTVKAAMLPEVRKRSIYNVLLYKSSIDVSGDFSFAGAKDIRPSDMLLNNSMLCVGISDFKGIEEKITTKFHGENFDMEPGMPDYAIDKQGLSVPVHITPENMAAPLSFAMNIKLKGSGQLHFLPLADNSQFEINSAWPNPSFDGSSLPKERTITKDGFTAKWSFNKANMPELNQLLKSGDRKESMAFGVSMVQPADQYAKTNRSVKYAILFIGLTFAMFFIIELMQKKQVHPVQYVLVGLALVIFYTLLLSIGEFTGFNLAYIIAAAATVSLIGMYAKSMFASYKTGAVLSGFLTMLYGFIYVLIQLEDTALLAGSIGLFILLAIAMHFSKKINWYGNATPATAIA